MSDYKGLIGQRVQIPAHYDAWMRGARFGVVKSFRRGKPGQSDYLSVALDHPGYKRALKLWKPDWDYAKFLGRSESASVTGKRNPKAPDTHPDGHTRRQWFGMIYDTCWRKGLPVDTATLKRYAGDAAWKRGDSVITVADKIEKAMTKKASVTGQRNPKPPTLSALRKEAAALGMRVTKNEDGEFRVSFASDREANAYYTDDAEDALGTMRHMASEGDRGKKASVTGSKNPIGKTGDLGIRWVIRAHHENGKLYYFTGQKLDSEKRLAKKFFAARDVEQQIKWLEARLPATIKFVDAVTV